MPIIDLRTSIGPRWAVGTYFWLVGVAVGVWVARIPEIQEKLHLDKSSLGGVLLMSALGALVGMPLTTRLADRWGTRVVAWGTAALVCVLLPLIAAAPSVATLMVVFGAYGAASGIHGVVINAMAVEVETAEARPILSLFHGLFSLGGLVGSLIAAGCLAWPVAPVPSLLAAAVVIAALYAGAGPALPVAVIRPAPRSGAATGLTPRRGAWPARRLIVLGGLAFLGLVGEGSMGDWSAVYLRQSLGASESLAGLGYAAYSLGMTSGRFAGEFLSNRLGDVALLRSGAGLAAVGLFGAVGSDHPLAAIAGFALVGAGLANAVPVLYRAAARTPGVDPVAGIATTSTVGYFGFVVGPPLIGLIADHASLGVALRCVAAALGVVALGGRQVRPPAAATDAADPVPEAPARTPLRTRLRRWLMRLGRVALLVYVGIVAIFFTFQTRLIFPGSATQGEPDATFQPPAGVDLVSMTTASGDRVVACFGKALNPDGSPRADPRACPTLLYFYGNGMSLADTGDDLERLRRLGANVMIPEYVGYGMSGGPPSEAGCRATAEVALAYLRARPDVDRGRIISAGWSLGGAVALDLAARHPVAGVATFCTFTSMAEMARLVFPFLPGSLLLRHRFDNLAQIARVGCPVLICHGRADRLIPFVMADRLAAAASGPVTRVTVDEAGHNDFFDVGGDEVDTALRLFIGQLPRRP